MRNDKLEFFFGVHTQGVPPYGMSGPNQVLIKGYETKHGALGEGYVTHWKYVPSRSHTLTQVLVENQLLGR